MRRTFVVTGVALLLSLTALDSRAAVVGRWTFDTDFSDSSGNNLHGTNAGNATAGVTGQGRPTGVLSLTGGADSFVNVADNALLDLPNTFTITAWVKMSAYPFGGNNTRAAFVRKLPDTGTGEVYSLGLRNNNGNTLTNLRFQAQSDTALAATIQDQWGNPQLPSEQPFLDQWTFVAATYDGTAALPTASLYRNDVIQTITNIDQPNLGPAPKATTGLLRIGGFPSPTANEGFNGFIDDVWIFNTALTDTEVASVRDGTYVPPTLTGDYNGNGHVDAADYVMWRKDSVSFGGPTGYETWRQHFGQPAGGGVSSSLGSVPEPGAAFYVVGCCFSILRLRRRRRRGSCSRISVNSAVSSGACSR